MIMADGTSECEKAGVSNDANSANGPHGHRGPVQWQRMEKATRDELARQLEEASAVARRLPTVAAAEKAGYKKASTYVPCIAAHYILEGSSQFDPFDLGEPELLLYTGTDPDSEIVGVSYGLFSETEPEGFAGPNDVWHNHTILCMKPGVVIGVQGATKEECEARGGVLSDMSKFWNNHLWIVPQWENPWGLFASEHPHLGGRYGDIDAPPDPNASDTWFDEVDD